MNHKLQNSYHHHRNSRHNLKISCAPIAALAALLIVLSTAPCRAETPAETSPLASSNEVPSVANSLPPSGYVEAGIGHARLTNGYADWNDQYVRGYAQIDAHNGINAEVSHQNHFGDQGTYIGAGNTHIFNDNWYGSIGGGGSSGGFFLPRLRVDAFLYRKWLDRKSFVTSIGAGYYEAKDGHYNRNLSLGAVRYFDAPWIIEGGVRLNQSTPGSIEANRAFAALTWGSNLHHFLTVRYEAGHEAYQLIGPSSVISDFVSNETSVVWRQWITSDLGFNLRADHYSNPSYQRNDIEAGLFLSF